MELTIPVSVSRLQRPSEVPTVRSWNWADAIPAGRDPRPPKGSPHVAVPATQYAVAFFELCGRIWLELERLSELWDRTAILDATPSELLWRAAILRLELLVILDSIGCARWRTLLASEQRISLGAMLADVLEVIAVAPDNLKIEVIERAQDRLLDEVITRYSETSRLSGGSVLHSAA